MGFKTNENADLILEPSPVNNLPNSDCGFGSSSLEDSFVRTESATLVISCLRLGSWILAIIMRILDLSSTPSPSCIAVCKAVLTI